jgi:hypothetical protein
MFSLYELFSIFTAGFSFIILLIKVLHCLCFRSRITINSNPNRNSNVFTINEQNNEVVISDIDSENDKRFEIEGFTNINFDELKVQEIHIDVVNHPQ